MSQSKNSPPVWKKIYIYLLIIFFLFSNTKSFASISDFSIADEAKLGKKFYFYLLTHYPIIYDPYIQHYLNKLVSKIKKGLPPIPFDITINLIYNKEINAFAGPGGHVFVNTGLVLAMENEAELASVLCHEFAHVTQRHIAQNIKRQKLLTVGSLVGILAGALIGKSAGHAVAVGSMAGVQSAMLKYTRAEEREADQVGIQYLTKAGYPASSMIEAFLKLKRHKTLSGENNIPPYFLTHPGIEERISYLKTMVKYLHNSNNGIKRNLNRDFDKVKALIIGHYSDKEAGLELVKKLSGECEKRVATAILYSRNNMFNEAEKLFEDDLCQRELPYYFREKGRFYFQMGKLSIALNYLNKAISIDSKDYFALYYRGRIYEALDELKLALKDMEKILEYVPHDSEIHMILGRIKGRLVGPFYGYIHYAYAELYKGNKNMMFKYYNRAKAMAKSENEKNMLKEFYKKYQEVKELW